MAAGLLLNAVVPEALDHIIEPVASQVLKYVIDQLGKTETFGDRVELWSDFRNTSKTLDQNGNPLLRPNRVRARLSPNVNPASLKWEGQHTGQVLGNASAQAANPSGVTAAQRQPWINGAFGKRHFQVFDDNEFAISLEEYVIGSAMSMQVEMELDSITEATDILSRLYQFFTNGQMMGYVDVQYDYPLPNEIQAVLGHLYSLRGPQKEDGSDDTCWKWLQKYSKNAISLLINRNKPINSEVVVNKNQFQAWMEIECSQEYPEPLDPDGAKITFTINIQYARVNMLMLDYPPVVNNKYVKIEYVPMPTTYRQASSSPIIWQNPAVSEYWKSLVRDKGEWEPVHYPWWDNWFMPSDSNIAKKGFKPIYTCAITLDNPENPEGETVIDLIDGLPGVTLCDAIVEELAAGKNQCLGVLRDVNVAVFSDDYQVEYRRIGRWVTDPDGSKHYEDRDALISLADGRHLVIKNRRTVPVYRLVISINPQNAVRNRYTVPLSMTFEETIDPATGRVASSDVATVPENN